MTEQIRVLINSDIDVVEARQKGRSLAEKMGFSSTELALIATAISELARNIVEHAGSGEIILFSAHQPDKKGITVIASDKGQGIPNIALAMQDGYSTKRGLGLGLSGAKRLMDEFEITSDVGKGTTVIVKKWRKNLG